MNNYTLAAQKIKECVSAQDVGEMMGLEIRHGRCRCPIHGGTDYNCVVYKGNRGYYCHVCKAGGDVISLVRNYYKTNFRDTIEWFNSAFNMGLDLDGQIDRETLRRVSEEQERRKKERERKEREERRKWDMFLEADMEVERLEEQRDKYVPRAAWEEWSDPFSEAVEKLADARREAQDLYFDCIEVKKDG